MKLIDKDAVVIKIDEKIKEITPYLGACGSQIAAEASNKIAAFVFVKDMLNNFEVKEVNLNNNGWIDCTKQMPKETKQTSDTLQGHREWTESDMVLVWDSIYGCGIDSTRNGKWRREGKGGYTGQVVHGIIAWRPIPKFSEEILQHREE